MNQNRTKILNNRICSKKQNLSIERNDNRQIKRINADFVLDY